MENQLSDILKIYHYGLNLFPYWTDELLNQWEKESCNLMRSVQNGLSLREFYLKLKKLSGLLNDGHSLIYLPEKIQEELIFSPVGFELIEEELVLSSVDSDFSRYLFRPIKRVNGLLTTEFLDIIGHHCWKHNIEMSLKISHYELSFLFNTTEFLIEFEDQESISIPFRSDKHKMTSDYKKKLERNHQIILEHEAISIYQVNQKIIIQINHFMSQELVSFFYHYVPLYLKSEELIFDLRGNSGGNSGLADEITQAFFEGEFETEKVSYQVTDGESIASASFLNVDETMRDDPEIVKMNQMFHHQHLITKIETTNYLQYQGILKDMPVKILQNQLTYSSAENFVMNFSNAKRATLIGTKTAGSTGQPALFQLKTGGAFLITAKKVEMPNGIMHHNLGIQPDIEIKETLEDRQKGIDLVLRHVLEN